MEAEREKRYKRFAEIDSCSDCPECYWNYLNDEKGVPTCARTKEILNKVQYKFDFGKQCPLPANYIESREKNLYPEEFLTWSNRNAYFDGKLWSIFTDEENEDIAEFTLPELFEYWKSEINK